MISVVERKRTFGLTHDNRRLKFFKRTVTTSHPTEAPLNQDRQYRRGNHHRQTLTRCTRSCSSGRNCLSACYPLGKYVTLCVAWRSVEHRYSRPCEHYEYCESSFSVCKVHVSADTYEFVEETRKYFSRSPWPTILFRLRALLPKLT